MRTKLMTLAAAGAALALVAAGSPNDRVTGGGQILVSEDGGAGDTIAFTAQEGRNGAVKGQVQYVDREGGTGQGQTVMHGTVTCLEVEANTAILAGQWRDGTDFEIHVVDNGEGVTAEGEDIVTVDNEPTDPNCQEDDGENEDPIGLARGNAQVYDAEG